RPAQGAGAVALRDAIWDAPREAGSGAVTTRGAVTPDPAGDAREDKPLVSIEDCHHNQAATEVLGCVHGDPDGGRRAVLVGDSKAAQWFPALDTIAEREGWRLEVLTKSACSFHPGTPAADYPECDAFNVALLDRLMADPP